MMLPAPRRDAEPAFASLVEAHHQLVWTICLAILGDRDLADEAVQEVFVTLWQRRHTIREARQTRAWLRQVAKRQSIDLKRRQERRRRLHQDAAVHAAGVRPPPETTPHVAMGEALAQLSEEQRALLIRFHLDDASSRTIAEEFGLTDGAVRKRLSRAREALSIAYQDQLRSWVKPSRPAGAIALAIMGGSASTARAATPVALTLIAFGLFVIGLLAGTSDAVNRVDDPVATPPMVQAASPVVPDEPVPTYIGMPETPDVQCELSHQLTTNAKILELHPETERHLGPLKAIPVDNWLTFQPRHPLGLGWLITYRFETLPIAWGAGACLEFVELTPSPIITLSGRVEGPITEAMYVRPEGCQSVYGHPFVEDDGTFEFKLFRYEDGLTCEFSASRTFGSRTMRSSKVPVNLDGVLPSEVVLVMPPLPPAGWDLYGERWRISEIEPESPTAEAGLSVGDYVVAIDGEPIEDLDLSEVVNQAPPFRVTAEGKDGLRTVQVLANDAFESPYSE
ncbi:MAG: sigma-70 family RNA polymerase sigma factor [Myxococcota bacterium]